MLFYLQPAVSTIQGGNTYNIVNGHGDNNSVVVSGWDFKNKYYEQKYMFYLHFYINLTIFCLET